MPMEQPPPPGVSNIGSGFERTPIEVEPVVPKRVQPKHQQKGPRSPSRALVRDTDPVLANLNKGKGSARRVGNEAPAGVQGKTYDVIDIPMPSMRTPTNSTCTFKSCDGKDYTFRVKDNKGRPLPFRTDLGLFVAMLEMAKGGSPVPVFEAFKFKLEDFNGQPVFPFPQKTLEDLMNESWDGQEQSVDEEPVEEEPPSGFSIGE